MNKSWKCVAGLSSRYPRMPSVPFSPDTSAPGAPPEYRSASTSRHWLTSAAAPEDDFHGGKETKSSWIAQPRSCTREMSNSAAKCRPLGDQHGLMLRTLC